MDEISVEQLISAHLAGDESAFTEIARRYSRAIYGYLFRLVGDAPDAEDLTQETFVKIWRNLRRYDVKRNFTTWSFAIARNTALDFFKKKRSIAFSTLEDDEGRNNFVENLRDESSLPPEVLERSDLVSHATEAIMLLPEKQRSVLHLHYVDQLSFIEICEIIGEPLETVRSRHHRAIQTLRKKLHQDHQ